MKDTNHQILGGFGGGGGGGQQSQPAQQQARRPVVEDDTLQSKAYARVLDAISEGEIQGLVDGDKSILLDDVPIRSEGGTLNFLDVTTRVRTGTQNQEIVEGFPAIETETAVNVTVEAKNSLIGTWSRDWWDATFTRASGTLTITATAHGLTNGTQVFLNFEDYNSPYDRLYTISNITTNTFDVTRYDSNFARTSGRVYVIRPYLKITATLASGSWTAGSSHYLTFLRNSSDSTRTSSSLWNQGYDAAQTILTTPAPTSTYFYIPWTDLAGDLSAAQIDGGGVKVTSGTYTRSGSTITIYKNNHGLNVGDDVFLTFLNGVFVGSATIFTVATASTNSFTITYVSATIGDTGTGTYFVDVPIAAGAVTRSITNPDVDRVRCKITVPSLQYTTVQNDVEGFYFSYAVDVQFNGGGYNQAEQRTIRGKTSSGYTFDREFSFKTLTGWNSSNISSNFPIDIRVRRISQDDTRQLESSAFLWQSYTEITDAKLRYPNTALVGIEINAEQFNSVPKRSYDIKGIKIRIPSNATVDSSTGRLTYTGTWDGTFAAATWCACPAWVLWDVLTSRRYGFGEQILTDAEKASFDGNASRLDKWSFYAASVYANQLVSTGLSSPTQEARFSCNVNIQGQQEAFTLVNELLSVFRSQAYWSNGSVTLAQDRPQDASYLFGASNVINGDFSYSGSDIKTRPTVVLVRWFNIKTRDVATEVVEDADLIDKYGVVKEEIDAFACTSQSQAARVGRWLLYSNAYEAETISFSIGIDSGVVLRPGMIIKVNDPTRAATRLSGRISTGSTTTTVVIDVDRTVTAGDDLSVVLPNGLVETRNVSSYNSGTRTITVDTAFSVAPQQNGIWLLTTSTVNPTTWRVISVGEDNTQGICGITALAYNPSKFAYVESGAELQTSSISILGGTPAAPTNITNTENLYADNNVVFVKVSLGWNRVENATQYRVRYRVNQNNWVNLADTESIQVDIFNAPEGNWQVEVYAISVNGNLSAATTRSFTVVGKTAVPSNVQGLEISQIDDRTAQLSWPAATDLDVLIGGKIIVRHTPATTSVEWGNSNDIIAAVAGSQTSAQVPLLSGTYLVKFEDSSGNRSNTATTVQVTLPQPQSPLPIFTYNEDTTSPPFQGNATNMLYDSGLDALILAQGILFDSLATDGDFDALTSIDQAGGIATSGEYEFGSTYAFAGVFDVDLTARFLTSVYLPGDLWDDKTALIDNWNDIDGSALDKVNATLYVRTTNNDPTINNPTWTQWQPIVNGIRRGRGFQFKLEAISRDSSQNIRVEELGATMTLQRRSETGNNLTSGAGSYAVTFTNAFYQTPSIGISGQNMATGDYYVLSSISRTGFTVTFRNSGGTAVSRTFDWTAVGHGKEIP